MTSDPQAPINQEPAASAVDRASLQPAAIGILAFIASCAALYFGREVLVPIAFAILLQALFRPIVRALEKLRLPTTVGAAVIVLTLLALLIVGGISLVGPIQRWVKNIPTQFEAAKTKFEKYRKPLQQISSVANQIEHAAQSPTTAPAAAPVSAATGPSLIMRLMGGTTQVFAKLAEVLLLLFLLLSTGDLFLQKLVKVIPLWGDKKEAVRIVEESQCVVMHYILLNAIVMACQGIIVALVLWALGMPSPWLWGIFSFLLELIPYIGGATMIVLLAIASFATFDGIGHILLIPASYLVITTIQSSVISPFAYGKRLKLNPVAVFIGVLFWFFLWGVPGAYLSAPIIALVKIIADRTENFAAIGEFLGE